MSTSTITPTAANSTATSSALAAAGAGLPAYTAADTLANVNVAVVAEALRAMREHDWDALAATLTDDVVWTLPGQASVSGRAQGIADVVAVAQKIASANLDAHPGHLMIGAEAIIATLCNTAEAPVHLHEQLALRFITDTDRITRIETHLSDIPMLNRFYAALDN